MSQLPDPLSGQTPDCHFLLASLQAQVQQAKVEVAIAHDWLKSKGNSHCPTCGTPFGEFADPQFLRDHPDFRNKLRRIRAKSL